MVKPERLVIAMIALRYGITQSTSEARLRLQKLIYRLQEHGMQTGYPKPSTNLTYDVYAVLTSQIGEGGWLEKAKERSFNDRTKARLAEFDKLKK